MSPCLCDVRSYLSADDIVDALGEQRHEESRPDERQWRDRYVRLKYDKGAVHGSASRPRGCTFGSQNT